MEATMSLNESGVNDARRPWPSRAEGADISQRRLLQSIVEVARSVFGAAAASVFLVDQASGELVFEAVSGEGEKHLVGSRFPGGTGIAGWVAFCGQPMLVDDVSQSPQFAQEAAAGTGYVPRSIMAAPLILDGECLGVLEVLDRGSRQRGELGDVDLLGLLATEVATAVELLVRLRWASAGSRGWPETTRLDVPLLERVAQRLPTASASVADTVTRLLEMADDLLADSASAADGDSVADQRRA
jgi:GAF domain-containing protein